MIVCPLWETPVVVGFVGSFRDEQHDKLESQQKNDR